MEDYFQVLNMADHIDREQWDAMELRCGDSTRRLLELFDRRGAKATFFFLGWIAERLPDLVREVSEAGHEIGSHGYDHRVLGDLGPEGFEQDLDRTSRILEGITGEPVTSFRACTWSIGADTLWAPAILARAGIRLDSSIYPVRHPDYGMPGAPAMPYRLETEHGELLEFPPLTWKIAGRRLPVGGGGYLRLFPTWMLARGLLQHERAGYPGCIYLHPWEVDPEQPRFGIGGLRRFRHYVNLAKTVDKLDRLLRRFQFVGLEAALSQCDNWRARCPALTLNALLG